MDVVELVVRKRHDPYPGVRLYANNRVAIGPPELAEALCRRGFFEKVAPEIIQQEAEAPKKERKGK